MIVMTFEHLIIHNIYTVTTNQGLEREQKFQIGSMTSTNSSLITNGEAIFNNFFILQKTWKDCMSGKEIWLEKIKDSTKYLGEQQRGKRGHDPF